VKLSPIPETFLGWIALKFNIATAPILDTQVALFLAKTIMADQGENSTKQYRLCRDGAQHAAPLHFGACTQAKRKRALG
jgi:hypothetical protein